MLESLTPSLRDQLEEKYELLEKLGEGGMGAVYKALHRKLEQIRVIKVMHSRLDEKSTFTERFRREAQVAAELSHPHIATLYDFDTDGQGSAYIVMEFIPGMTLKQILAQGGGLSQDFIYVVAQQSLSALGYLHRRGFVHRDVAPDNLMVSSSDSGAPRVTLIDLGIAKGTNDAHEAELTRSGVFLGKIKYASPEHFGHAGSSARPDPRSDLYSLGLVFYQLFTGRFPIRGDSSPAMIAGHLYQPPLPFEESDPHGRVPKPVRAAILRSLEKDPDDRFPDARAFAEALLAGVDLQPLSDSAMWLGRGVPTSKSLEEAPTIVMKRPGALRPKASAAGLAALLFLGVLTLASGLVTIEALPFTGWLRSDVHERGGAAALLGLDYGPFYALVIANNLYLELPRLETPVGDGRAVARILQERYGFEVEIVENATRVEMLKAIERYEKIEPGSNLLVFYAGHGEIDPISERAYWMPVDAEPGNTANLLEAREVVEAVDRIPAQRVLVIADSCFSGGLNDSGTALDGSPLAETELVDGAGLSSSRGSSDEETPDYGEMRRQFELESRLVLSSGDLTPISDIGRKGHSILVNALLDALDRRDEAPAVFDALTLFRQIEQPVRRVSSAQGTPQEPRFGTLEGHAGGDFYFVPSH